MNPINAALIFAKLTTLTEGTSILSVLNALRKQERYDYHSSKSA